MGKRKSIFTEDIGKQVVLQTKVPETLKQRIDDINSQLKELNLKKSFNVSDILSDAITEAVEIAETELNRMAKKSQPKTQARVADEKKEEEFA